jgi:hypothetical protein
MTTLLPLTPKRRRTSFARSLEANHGLRDHADRGRADGVGELGAGLGDGGLARGAELAVAVPGVDDRAIGARVADVAPASAVVIERVGEGAGGAERAGDAGEGSLGQEGARVGVDGAGDRDVVARSALPVASDARGVVEEPIVITCRRRRDEVCAVEARERQAGVPEDVERVGRQRGRRSRS